jgi:hypothetical protein
LIVFASPSDLMANFNGLPRNTTSLFSAMAAPERRAFSYKDDDEEYFRLQEEQNWRTFERGFLQIWQSIPDRSGVPSIPPSEHYDHIKLSLEQKNSDLFRRAVREFADFVYKNGFDDEDELERFGVLDVLLDVCRIPELGAHAFHLVSLLQTKGPAFPAYLQSPGFITWCFEFVRHRSPVVYYALTCLANHCALGESQTRFVEELVPIVGIGALLENATDDVREALFDLACRYSKCALAPEEGIELIHIATIGLVCQAPAYFASCFWILVRLLRHYPESIIYILVPDVLRHTNQVLRCRNHYALVPGLIFISYVYEFGESLPEFSTRKILRRLSAPSDPRVQRQVCRTLTKIAVRRPDMIPHFLRGGIFGHILDALDGAKFRDKIEIGFLACALIKFGGQAATERVFATKCINLWLDLVEYDDEELNAEIIATLDTIFAAAAEVGEKTASRICRRFVSCNGLQIVQKLIDDESAAVADPARQLFDDYLADIAAQLAEEEEDEQVRERDHEEDLDPFTTRKNW